MHWRERQRSGNHERRFEESIGLIKGTLFKYVIDVVEEGVGELRGSITSAEKSRASSKRDLIAQQMWTGYQQELSKRRR